jgi:DNA-binding transcriptional LysR family regulator
MNKLELITTFISVIEQNSFVKAAKELGTSTPTVSRKVKALEKELKVQLIKRSTRSLTLTEIGKRYYEEAQKLISQFTQTESLIAQTHAEPAGELKVMATRHIANSCLIPHLNKFLDKYPKIDLNLEIAERFPDMARENVDLLIGVAVEGPENLVRRRIRTAHRIFCASPNYLKKAGIPHHPNDLKTHKYIAHSIRVPSNYVTFSGHSGLYLKPVLLVNDISAIIRCALNDMGIINLLDYHIIEELKSGKLITVLDNYSEEERPIYLFYQNNNYLEPKLRKFIDFFIPFLQATLTTSVIPD